MFRFLNKHTEKYENKTHSISIDFVNQGERDYLGAEISINNQIICLLAITDELGLSLTFFHESRLVADDSYQVDYAEFMQLLKSCESELQEVIEQIKSEPSKNN